jgi:hypothetical protein
MAAVRAIEHVSVWTTAGGKHWADFAASYFKKAQARVVEAGNQADSHGLTLRRGVDEAQATEISVNTSRWTTVGVRIPS